MHPKTAIQIVLGILTLVIAFHVSILLKIVPYDITWGGRLKSDAEMYVFESISIVINLLLVFVLLIKGKYIKAFLSTKLVNVVLWVCMILFALNTLGNLVAKTNLERTFAFVTLALAILIGIILNKPKGT